MGGYTDLYMSLQLIFLGDFLFIFFNLKSPKGLDWPLHREKKKKRGILWAGLELKVSVDVGLKQLKAEDGGWE